MAIGIFVASVVLIYFVYIALKIGFAFATIGGDSIPKITDSVNSPNERYTMNIYFIDGGPISADVDRIEIVDNKNNEKWEIYYEYKGNLKKYSWIDNDNVSINDDKINIHKDKYHLKD